MIPQMNICIINNPLFILGYLPKTEYPPKSIGFFFLGSDKSPSIKIIFAQISIHETAQKNLGFQFIQPFFPPIFPFTLPLHNFQSPRNPSPGFSLILFSDSHIFPRIYFPGKIRPPSSAPRPLVSEISIKGFVFDSLTREPWWFGGSEGA